MSLDEAGLIAHRDADPDKIRKIVLKYLKENEFEILDISERDIGICEVEIDGKIIKFCPSDLKAHEVWIKTTYKPNRNPDRNISINITQIPKLGITLTKYSYIQYYEPIMYNESKEYYLLINLLKKLIGIDEPIIAFNGIMDFWPRLDKLLDAISHGRVPISTIFSTISRKRIPAYENFLFLSNESAKNYHINPDELKKRFRYTKIKITDKGITFDWNNLNCKPCPGLRGEKMGLNDILTKEGASSNFKGVVNEMDDADYFLSRGYTVERASGEPGDLVVSKNGVKFRIECKASKTDLSEKIAENPDYLDELVKIAKEHGEKPAVRVKDLEDVRLVEILEERGIIIFWR